MCWIERIFDDNEDTEAESYTLPRLQEGAALVYAGRIS
jgi:hypothetical protein